MGAIVRQYGLDILTSRVGTEPSKYVFKDKEQATWAAHMATVELNLYHRIKLLPAQTDGNWVVSVAVNEHNVEDNPRTYAYKGWMLRLEYQHNLKHLFDEHN